MADIIINVRAFTKCVFGITWVLGPTEHASARMDKAVLHDVLLVLLVFATLMPLSTCEKSLATNRSYSGFETAVGDKSKHHPSVWGSVKDFTPSNTTWQVPCSLFTAAARNYFKPSPRPPRTKRDPFRPFTPILVKELLLRPAFIFLVLQLSSRLLFTPLESLWTKTYRFSVAVHPTYKTHQLNRRDRPWNPGRLVWTVVLTWDKARKDRGTPVGRG